jgi:phage major head subunit gpT-like protein
MAIVTPDFLSALFTNYSVIWEQEFLAAETAIDFERFAMRVPSSTSQESYNWLGEVPRMSEWLDQRSLQGLATHNFTIVNKHFEATIEVDRNTIEDDKYNLIRPRIAQLAQEAARFPAELASKVLGAGGSNPCYDGSSFFSTSHVEEATQAAQSNLVTGTGTTLAQVRADLITARTTMRAIKDGKGRPMNLRPDLALVPPSLQDVFEQLINTNIIALSTGTQMTNVLRGTVDIMVDANLTTYNPAGGANSWYLMCTTQAIKPLIYQVRKEPEFVALDNPSDPQAFLRRRFLYGVDFRANVGYGLWQMAQQIVNA